MPELESHLSELVDQLHLSDKVRLLTGGTFWSTVDLPSIGLSAMILSDGPSGVRGEHWDERDPSLNLPNGTALAASWDPGLASRYGAVSAGEARRKGVHVILGPTINLHRSPLGGRAFECFSEDPLLSGRMAAAYVEGVQRHGVAATPKHYVANDFETERLTASVEVSERVLRELYLAAFEPPVVEAGAWAVMSAYNQVNGVTMTENDLLETPLNSEWAFDGVVVSDWGAVRSLDSARSMQDLVMPGPEGPWGQALVHAVEQGSVSEADIDRKVRRILRLAARVGALSSVPTSHQTVPATDGHDFARETETNGIVLVQNRDIDGNSVLPLANTALRVGVYGQNARFARTQGGGSATVLPEKVVSPLEALTKTLGAGRVEYRAGAGNPDSLLDFPTELTRTPEGEQGALVQLRRGGTVIHSEVRRAGSLVDLDAGAPLEEADELVVSVRLQPSDLRWMRVGFATLGRTVLRVDGEILLDETLLGEGEEVGATFLTPPIASAVLPDSHREVLLEYVHDLRSRPADAYFAFSFGYHPLAEDAAALRAEAVHSARQVDVAVVVVGTSSRIESEGFDRTTLSLADDQDALVRAVAATGTPTVVVVNSGAPVALPWRDDVAAILVTWFGGEAYGQAVSDVLLGHAEPGGRLPMTWPHSETDTVLPSNAPVDGVLPYGEGLHIGYRAWIRAGQQPAFMFGHGLSYTSFDVALDGSIREEAGDVVIPVRVTNTGSRRGKHVVQVYLSRDVSTVERPSQWLAGFESVWLDPLASMVAEIRLPRRAFGHWDPEVGSWVVEPGQFDVLVARSAGLIDARSAIVVA
ncbi:glycoside hydrolase family 3 C-terminal domain-containing protein [Microbacterium sp. ISL-103]|uniref:beta-glucosidase family protein n=1 Tax=Microbacterium sp. ISL-103 TaxID=2819156 RepID=UPI001BE7D237|nr:glycoside hydrolase family 3 C-terminal domain-containing protein [Microbacterium sp. ISL-103]MBT2474927.1 glycoside hydrolase family 3 C-terminal domain-containing protein [Microbacterium sp. ISL-103]